MKPIQLTTHDGLKIAAHKLEGESPTTLFVPGFFSNMEGTKATFLEKQCKKRGRAYIRFDYRGHGQSDGKFEDGTLTDWLNDTLLVLDELADAPVVAVGSSMGGWIAVLAALRRPDKICGLVGIASSPDFTEDIWHRRMTDQQQSVMNEQGYIAQPSEYRDEPIIITKRLLDSGKDHLLLHKKSLDFDIPVTLIHGMEDRDVPWQKSEKLNRLIGEEQSELILVPDGAHRLSRDKDLELIDREIVKLLKKL
ncbi:alpha/beta hydrolase [Rhodohalobacter sp.]|uniref:alpha/beta hydrolase n=1 Tax=Rhodohalobacter sp. TaxID=1974210 RepID=UPI002ACE8B9E|nr:alpha/beta hydrolase [Rhodohalobacter sp.]MDZ7758608.1 alpha/beta hydrolase [Rhodohalobacter sp.]